MDEAKLMNRIDRKYWFHVSQLDDFLTCAAPFYEILEINGQRLMEYQTTYFDTPQNKLYLLHHNQKLNRFKIRRRNYGSTGSGFFELKKKTNKKRTVKFRIETDINIQQISHEENEFLKEYFLLRNEDLQPALCVQFKRLTLVHKAKNDRCTIDLSPKFSNKHGEITLENLAIFELKRGRNLNLSPMISILRKLQIKHCGLSKYCTGRALLEPGLKQNAFKSRLRYLKNLHENDFNYANSRN